MDGGGVREGMGTQRTVKGNMTDFLGTIRAPENREQKRT